MKYLFNVVRTENIVGMVEAESAEAARDVLRTYIGGKDTPDVQDVRKSFEDRIALGDKRPIEEQ